MPISKNGFIFGFPESDSQRVASVENIDKQNNHSEQQKQMNQTSKRIAGDDSEQPQNQNNNENRAHHKRSFELILRCGFTRDVRS